MYAPPTDTYTLSLHDALPIWAPEGSPWQRPGNRGRVLPPPRRAARTSRTNHIAPVEQKRAGRAGRYGGNRAPHGDRKSTRLNSSHVEISYAVFCLKKKKK